MADDTKRDSPDVDEFFARDLETCRRPRVEPVSLERAQELFDEWSEAVREAPQTRH